MAAGRPVVATSVRGSRDLIEHEVNGWLVECDDAAGLAEALRRLIRDPSMRVEMGKRRRERIKTYALGCVLGEMWPIYDSFQRLGPSGISKLGRG